MILIDMNMPQSCQECPAFATKACDKWDKHKTFSDQRTTRHKDCPLHESDVIEVLQEIRQDIDKYLYDNEFGSDYRADVARIIDSHMDQYKEDAE